MSRYTLPEPTCRHKPTGTVTAGDLSGGPHAGKAVCDRPACIADATEWAETYTRKPAVHKTFAQARAEAT